MKKLRPIFFAAFCLLTVCFLSCSRKSDPQAATSAPMVAVLEAAKKSDVKMFMNAYSERIRNDTGQGDWDRNLKEAQARINATFGDFQLSDFTFSFEGDAVKGKLAVSFKGNKQFEFDVVKENDAWKLDEH